MVNPVISPTIVEGRDTKAINQSLYLQYFVMINGIAEDKLHISTDNEAFNRYQKNDSKIAAMGDTLAELESKAQEIEQMLPGLIERSKTKATEHEVLQAQVAKLQSLKMAMADINKTYPLLRTKATNAFNSSLLTINNAPGAHGVDEMTPKELTRQTTLFNEIASARKETGELAKELGAMHRIVSDYHTTFGPPKLREKVAPAATTTVAPAANTTTKPSGSGGK